MRRRILMAIAAALLEVASYVIAIARIGTTGGQRAHYYDAVKDVQKAKLYMPAPSGKIRSVRLEDWR